MQPDDNKVISMAEKAGDATLWAPEDALRDALSDIGNRGAFENGKKLLILALDDTDGYHLSFIQAGMKTSECIALCEAGKIRFFEEMGLV